MSYQTHRAGKTLNPFTDLAPTPALEIREGKLVKVRAIKAFYAAGKLVNIGDVIELREHDAISLRALRRAEPAH